jgi:transcriptional regulator with GAF, ATPase, and Fis domain
MNNELAILNQPNDQISFAARERFAPAAEPLNNRVEALRVLATVLLREVESLEKAVPNNELKEIFSLAEEVERYEADMIRCALIKSNGRQRRAAKLLGVKVTTLNCKIKKYNINWRAIGLESEMVS